MDKPVIERFPGAEDGAYPINVEEALNRVLGDVRLIKVLVDGFIEEFDNNIEEIRDTLIQGDADGLARKAHRLKGAAASLAMKPIANEAFALEQMGRYNQMDGVPGRIETLIAEGERMKAFAESIDWTALKN